MTTTLIHDPLLFYPYSQSHYEYTNYTSKMEYNDKDDQYSMYSASSTASSPSTSSLSSIPSCVQDTDWDTILSSMKKVMYNSTSATVPSPATYICKNSGFAPDPSKDPAFFYNSYIKDVNDMYSYRQLRSENLLYRMLNCPMMKIDVDQTSVMRLTKGVFVANKIQQSIAPPPVPRLDMDSSFLNHVDESVDGIDTFHFGDMKRFVSQQQQQQQQQSADFIPFSYTFGARFTDPYHGRDIVIRGQGLPLWCQTLFLNECVNRMPLKPNVPYTGLFPFAPGFTVVFQTLNNQCNVSPDLTFIYEGYAMEYSDPVNILIDEDNQWGEHCQNVARDILLCDIPEGAAEVLAQLADLWASDQGLVL